MGGTGRGSSWLALVAPEIVTCPEDVIATFLETLLHLAVLLPLPAPASIKHTHTTTATKVQVSGHLSLFVCLIGKP